MGDEWLTIILLFLPPNRIWNPSSLISIANSLALLGCCNNLLLVSLLSLLPTSNPSLLAAQVIYLKLEHESLLPKILPRLRRKPVPYCGRDWADLCLPVHLHFVPLTITYCPPTSLVFLHFLEVTKRSPSAGSASCPFPHSSPLSSTSPPQRGLPSLYLSRSPFPPRSPSLHPAVSFITLTIYAVKNS